MKRIFVIIIAGTLALACGNNNNNNRTHVVTDDKERVDTRAEENDRIADLTGTYRGTLPCADCGGIEVRLTLHKDRQFELKTKHISNKENEQDMESEYDGAYSWDQSTGIVTLHGLVYQPTQYMVLDNALVQLDMEGRRIEGPLADKYILRK